MKITVQDKVFDTQKMSEVEVRNFFSKATPVAHSIRCAFRESFGKTPCDCSRGFGLSQMNRRELHDLAAELAHMIEFEQYA